MSCIGFIGAGNMARAMGGGLKASGASATLIAVDPDEAARARFAVETGGRAVVELDEVLSAADVLVLAVKPQMLAAVLDRLAGKVRPEQLVLSIAAGFTFAGLAGKLGASTRLVRAMPNTPAMVREGMTVLVGGGAATPADLETARQIFVGVGDAVVVDDEALLDAVTAVSGSGPGFVFAFAEAWLRARRGRRSRAGDRGTAGEADALRCGRAVAAVRGPGGPPAGDGELARRHDPGRAGSARGARLRRGGGGRDRVCGPSLARAVGRMTHGAGPAGR